MVDAGDVTHRRNRSGWLLALAVSVIVLVLRQSTEIRTLTTIIGETPRVPSHKRWMNILEEAGVETIELKAFASLPEFEALEEIYGKSPHILGLDRCEEFRNGQSPMEAIIAIAGNFNTNTNHLYDLLIRNCRMPSKKGIHWQVPWSKHLLAQHRLNYTNVSPQMGAVKRRSVMPIVTVRDPYYWMQAMCRNRYATRWTRDLVHCPNLVLENGTHNRVRVRYDENLTHWFESLADFWNVWNNQYYEADYPRLMVRFEDIIFHTKETVRWVCECGGGNMTARNFDYKIEATKINQQGTKATDWLGALAKYGNVSLRLEGFQKPDLEHAERFIDPKLLHALHYQDIQTPPM